jgi:LPXTG-site transpeptidase (sortase) family protein
MQQRTPFQKLLVLLNLTLVLLILAVGVDLLVTQNNLTGRKNSITERRARIKQNKQSPNATPSPSPTPLFPLVSAEKPVSIEIPTIGLNASVIDVGVNARNEIDVPADATKVGWYERGPKPGEKGGSILTAHYDTPSGKPAIFYNLRSVNRGDLIFVRMENDEELLFQVQDVISEPLSTFPTDLVFGKYDTKELILITCDGIWNPIEKTYSKRLVVFATLWQNKTL